MPEFPSGPGRSIVELFSSIRDPYAASRRWRRRYGDPITLHGPGGSPVVVTGDPEGIRAIFTAPADTFEPVAKEMMEPLMGDRSIFTTAGSAHLAMRRLVMPPFHGQRMRLYGRRIHDITLRHAQGLQPGRPLVAQELMHAISLEVIIQLVFGVTAPDRVARVARLVEDFRRALSGAVLPMLVPWLRREFHGIGPWARFQRATRALHGFLGEELARRRSGEVEGGSDILSMLLAARHEDGTGMPDEQIFQMLQALLFAGHATTAIAMCWALCFLAAEPQCLGLLRAELSALSPDADPDAVERAPYLEAVCLETLRLRPATGVAGRKLARPMTLCGYSLPAGWSVGASVLWAHSAEAVFPEPERFLPARFIGRAYSPFEFLPFGGGHRRCVGAAFALFEMKWVLATLLQRFSFEMASQRPLRVIQRDVLLPSGPIRMVLNQR